MVDHFPLKAVSEFVRLDKLTYDRTDAAQIQRVDDWIDAHCDAEKGEFAYMIPHDMLYNSDMFQYAALPDIQLQGKLAAGISIPGHPRVPGAVLEAKYVLTAEPLPQTFVSGGELSGRWNALFCAARDEHFTQAASFDMGNGTVFTVWERTEPATGLRWNIIWMPSRRRMPSTPKCSRRWRKPGLPDMDFELQTLWI